MWSGTQVSVMLAPDRLDRFRSMVRHFLMRNNCRAWESLKYTQVILAMRENVIPPRSMHGLSPIGYTTTCMHVRMDAYVLVPTPTTPTTYASGCIRITGFRRPVIPRILLEIAMVKAQYQSTSISFRNYSLIV